MCNRNDRRPNGNGFRTKDIAPDVESGALSCVVSTKLGGILIDLMVQSSNLSGVTSRSVLNMVLARRYSTNLTMLGGLDHDQLAMAVSPASGADGNSIQARTFKPKALSPDA